MARTKQEIIDLQTKLNSLGYWVDIDGVYGPQTKATETTFIHNKPLNLIQFNIIDSVKSYVGQQEISGNLGFKTPFFHKLMVGVGFQRTHPWCCYFAELCWREGYKKALPNRADIDQILHTLFSASVMQTRNNFAKSGIKYGFTVTMTPEPGSLIIWQSAKNKSFGHIGIVTGVVGNTIYTIEGNTDTEGSREGIAVAKKVRTLDFTNKKTGLNLIGFINLSQTLNKIV